MNSDVFAGRWKQLKGSMREWWGELTDDDLDRIAGKKDKLLGVLQERYGWTRERAEDELEARLRDYDTTPLR